MGIEVQILERICLYRKLVVRLGQLFQGFGFQMFFLRIILIFGNLCICNCIRIEKIGIGLFLFIYGYCLIFLQFGNGRSDMFVLINGCTIVCCTIYYRLFDYILRFGFLGCVVFSVIVLLGIYLFNSLTLFFVLFLVVVVIVEFFFRDIILKVELIIRGQEWVYDICLVLLGIFYFVQLKVLGFRG